MLTVILMLGVGGSLLAMAFGSILRSQRRVVEFGNRFAQTEDFLRCLSGDVRRATVATLAPGGTDGVRQVLLIGQPPAQMTYRFYDRKIQRTAGKGTVSSSEKCWDPLTVEAEFISGTAGSHDTGVRATVFWRHETQKELEPERRFDLFVRVGGELGDEAE